MEAAIQTLVKVYLKSSKGKENLGKKDFQSLVKSQLGNILSDASSKDAVNNMAAGLDENQDGRLGFQEYMKLIGYLAVSLSDQRALANEPAQNSATGQVAQSSPDKEDKPEANAEAKEEAPVEVKEETTAEASAEVKVEACVAPKAEGEVKAEGEEKAEGEALLNEVATSVEEVVITTTTTVVKVTEDVTGEVKEVKEVEIVEKTVKVEDEVPVAEVKTQETTS